MIFNSVYVTIFDFRLNTLLWLTLAAVCGVLYNHNSLLKKQQSLATGYFLNEDNYLISQAESSSENR